MFRYNDYEEIKEEFRELATEIYSNKIYAIDSPENVLVQYSLWSKVKMAYIIARCVCITDRNIIIICLLPIYMEHQKILRAKV